MVLEADIQNERKVKEFLSDTKKGLEDVGQRFSSQAAPEHVEKMLKSLHESPKMKKVLEDLQGSIYGVSHAESEKVRRLMEKNGVANAEAYYKAYYTEKKKFMDYYERELQIPREVTGRQFDSLYGKELGTAADMLVDRNAQNSPQHMSGIGKYVLMGLIGNLITTVSRSLGDPLFGTFPSQAEMMTTAQQHQASGMAFSSSLLGHRLITSETDMQNRMRQLELEKTEGGALGSVLGYGLPIAIGLGLAPFTGGASLMWGAATSLGTGPLGTELGTYPGTENISEEMKEQTPFKAWNKLMAEYYGIAGERVSAFERKDVAETLLRARYGTGIEGRGLGYSDDQLARMQYMSGMVTDNYNSSTFKGQLAFSRAYGYSFQDIAMSNMSSRFTGEEVGPSELMMRKNVADTTGAKLTDLNRSLVQLSQIMARVGSSSESGMMRASMLANTIFPNGDPRGKMDLMGMETIAGLQSMFQNAPGSAEDAFMFQALGPLHGGDLWEFEKLKSQGIFGEGTMENVAGMVGQYGDRGKWVLNALTKGNVPLSDALSKKITEMGPEAFMKEWNEKTEGIEENTEEQKKVLQDMLGIAVDNVSKTEQFQSEMINRQASIGEVLQDSFYTLQKIEEGVRNQTLTEMWPKMFEELQKMGEMMLEATREISKNYQREMDITDRESDFIYNLTRPKGSKERGWAENIINDPFNKGFISKVFPNNFGDTSDSMIVPYEFDKDGNVMTYLKVKSGASLGNGDYFMIKDPSEAGRMSQQYTDFGGKRPTIKHFGTSEGVSSANLNVNIEVNPMDRAALHRDIDKALDEVQALMAHPRKINN